MRGNPARSLTSTEIAALNRNSAFDVGHTLIHLAIAISSRRDVTYAVGTNFWFRSWYKAGTFICSARFSSRYTTSFCNMLRIA
ncbi:hypothetical protein DOY81_015006 [Sarcophaga bullata]|nr:hypothetical protein DOY81_015006 [Sarcophaga bullata]